MFPRRIRIHVWDKNGEHMLTSFPWTQNRFVKPFLAAMAYWPIFIWLVQLGYCLNYICSLKFNVLFWHANPWYPSKPSVLSIQKETHFEKSFVEIGHIPTQDMHSSLRQKVRLYYNVISVICWRVALILRSPLRCSGISILIWIVQLG